MPGPLNDEARKALRESQPLWFSAHYLRLLHYIHQPTIERLQARRNERLWLHNRIATLAEGGKILVIESGRDCDGCEYTGRTRLIDAAVAAFDQLDRELSKWADGPYRLTVARPSEQASITYESRDLVAEAHEDGHSHVIYSRFP